MPRTLVPNVDVLRLVIPNVVAKFAVPRLLLELPRLEDELPSGELPIEPIGPGVIKPPSCVCPSVVL